MTDDPNMIVHAVDLHLQVGIALNQTRVRILASLQLTLQVHNLVFLRPDLDLDIFQLRNKIQISIRLLVRSLMQIRVLFFVALLKCFQVVQFVHEAAELGLQVIHLTFAFLHLLFFLLQVVLLLIDLSVQVFGAIQGF